MLYSTVHVCSFCLFILVKSRVAFLGRICHTACMSDSRTIKNPSPLVLAVLALDEHFSDLKRLSARIDEIDMKSNFDFEQSERMINLFAETGQAISGDIANFVDVLNEARAEAELAAQKVSLKAEQLKVRKEEIQSKMTRFHSLSEKVGQLNETLLHFRRSPGEALSEQDRAELKVRLAEIASQLNGLIDEAQELQNVGHDSKIKILEQNADSMRQSLIAVSKKIDTMITVQ